MPTWVDFGLNVSGCELSGDDITFFHLTLHLSQARVKETDVNLCQEEDPHRSQEQRRPRRHPQPHFQLKHRKSMSL